MPRIVCLMLVIGSSLPIFGCGIPGMVSRDWSLSWRRPQRLCLLQFPGRLVSTLSVFTATGCQLGHPGDRRSWFQRGERACRLYGRSDRDRRQDPRRPLVRDLDHTAEQPVEHADQDWPGTCGRLHALPRRFQAGCSQFRHRSPRLHPDRAHAGPTRQRGRGYSPSDSTTTRRDPHRGRIAAR